METFPRKAPSTHSSESMLESVGNFSEKKVESSSLEFTNTTTESISFPINPSTSQPPASECTLLIQFFCSFVFPTHSLLVSANVLGNLFILCLICSSRQFRRPANYLLANLSVASLVAVIGSLWIHLQRLGWTSLSNYWLCHSYPILRRIGFSADGFTIICICLDRSRVVQNPLDRETSSSALRKIMFIWLTSLSLEFPQTFFYHFSPSQPIQMTSTNFKCAHSKHLFQSTDLWVGYVLSYFVLAYLIPTLLIIKDLLKTIHIVNYLCTCTSLKGKEILSMRGRVLIYSSIFGLIFVCIKLPGGLWYTLYQLPKEKLPPHLLQLVAAWKSVISVLVFSHSWIYPCVVILLSGELRNSCKRILLRAYYRVESILRRRNFPPFRVHSNMYFI